MGRVVVHEPVAGSYSSAELMASFWRSPPTTRTVPSGSRVAVCPLRTSVSSPVAIHEPVAGSYSSAEFDPPAATRTVPLRSSVAVWPAWPSVIDPVAIQRPVTVGTADSADGGVGVDEGADVEEGVGAGGGPTLGARSRNPMPIRIATTAAATANASGAKRVMGGRLRSVVRPGTALRWVISNHKSGAGAPSRLRNRSRSSVIAVTQDLLEPLAAAAQVGADGELRGPGAAGDGPHRRIGVIEEHDGCALLRSGRWLRASISSVSRSLVQVAHIGDERGCRSALLQLASGNTEGGSPHPCLRIVDGSATTKSLGVGLGHRITGNLWVPGEGQERAP